MRICLLGGFQVEIEGQPVTAAAWRQRNAAAIIKLLALAPQQALGREELSVSLWPDADSATVSTNLRQFLHVARQVLAGSGVVGPLPRLPAGRIGLAAGPVWVDVVAFEEAAARARGRYQLAAYQVALDLYGGDLLPEDPYEEWAVLRRTALRATWLQLHAELAQCQEAAALFAAAIATWQRAVLAEPADEQAQIALMRLYALTGQRALALRQWAQLVTVLARDLDAAPATASQELHRAIVAGRFPSQEQLGLASGVQVVDPSPPNQAARPAGAVSNLAAPLTNFIGRQQELSSLVELLSGSSAPVRLLTLTGAGSCGKTRLALELGEQVRANGRYPDGVWLVELAHLSDPALVLQGVAEVLQVRQEPGRTHLGSLTAALQHRRLLLILDNCEHLLDACAELVQALLQAAPQVQVLATSRAALRVPDERLWRVPPLTLPTMALSPAGLATNDAAALFVDRVYWQQPAFALSAEHSATIVMICQRLGGLPLALELAAARTAVLSVAQIAARLDDALTLLTGGARTLATRQQTMRATLDWSYALLDDAEPRLLRWLAIFAGSWSVAALLPVCADPGQDESLLLDLLGNLVNHSLVQVVGDQAVARYYLLEPIRQYAWALLVAEGAADTLHTRLAAYMVAQTAGAAAGLAAATQRQWLRDLEQELPNLRVVLRWLVQSEQIDTMQRLCLALWCFWLATGRNNEGSQWLRACTTEAAASAYAGTASHPYREALLALSMLLQDQNDLDSAATVIDLALAASVGTDDDIPTAAHFHRAHLNLRRGEYAPALAHLYAALGDYHKRGIVRHSAITLRAISVVRAAQGDYLGARQDAEAALALNKAIANDELFAAIYLTLGDISWATHDLLAANEYYAATLRYARASGFSPSLARALAACAQLCLRQADAARGVQYLQEALALYRSQDPRKDSWYCLALCALAIAAGGQPSVALRLAATADSLRSGSGDIAAPYWQRWYDGALATIRQALDAATARAAWRDGGLLTLAAALDLATRELAPNEP